MTTKTQDRPRRVSLDWEVVPKAPETIILEQSAQIADLLKQAEVAAVRHRLATAFTGMMVVAQAAALNYGIDYAKLPSYADPDGLLKTAQDAPVQDGEPAYMEYIARIEHDLAAAIRRKQMRGGVIEGGRLPVPKD